MTGLNWSDTCTLHVKLFSFFLAVKYNRKHGVKYLNKILHEGLCVNNQENACKNIMFFHEVKTYPSVFYLTKLCVIELFIDWGEFIWPSYGFLHNQKLAYQKHYCVRILTFLPVFSAAGERSGPTQCYSRTGSGCPQKRRSDRHHHRPLQTRGWDSHTVDQKQCMRQETNQWSTTRSLIYSPTQGRYQIMTLQKEK